MEIFQQISGLLDPRSVAIIGASANTEGWSGAALPVLRKLGFSGDIYPVNPKYDDLDGLRCYPSVEAIPGKVDVALMFVPQRALREILEQCGRKGVQGAVILASGFSETGKEGKALEEQLRKVANQNQIAICGPNCLGLANLKSGFIGLTSATFPANLSPGRTALISQSGQLLMILLARAHDQGVRMRYLVSTGNELNVEAADYGLWVLQDPEITSVCMVLEGLRSPSRFLDLVARAQEVEKPLIVMKLGRSQRAARTALAHTGKLAGAFRTYEAVFRQENIISVDDPLELADVAALFEKCNAPSGKKISVVTFSGGWCGVIADQAEVLGLELADFSDKTDTSLKPLLDFTPPANPLDLSGNVMTHPERWGAALEIVLADENTDIMVVFIHQVREAWRHRLIGPLLELVKTRSKPMIVVYDGGKVVEAGYTKLVEDGSVPVFRGSQQMLRALKRFIDYHELRNRGRKVLVEANNGETLRQHLVGNGKNILEHTAKAALATIGIPMVGETLVTSKASALEAAETLGYPVVLKGLADNFEHKTEAGLVRLNLSTPKEVHEAFALLSDQLKDQTLNGASASILVQKMVKGGVEVLLGIKNDDVFGPMVVLGVGGIMAELIDDVALRRAPLSRRDIVEMIEETRLGNLLAGFRGSPVADRVALEEAVLRLSRAAVANADQINSIDINPLIVLPVGEGCIMVDALIVKKEEIL